MSFIPTFCTHTLTQWEYISVSFHNICTITHKPIREVVHILWVWVFFIRLDKTLSLSWEIESHWRLASASVLHLTTHPAQAQEKGLLFFILAFYFKKWECQKRFACSLSGALKKYYVCSWTKQDQRKFLYNLKVPISCFLNLRNGFPIHIHYWNVKKLSTINEGRSL